MEFQTKLTTNFLLNRLKLPIHSFRLNKNKNILILHHVMRSHCIDKPNLTKQYIVEKKDIKIGRNV